MSRSPELPSGAYDAGIREASRRTVDALGVVLPGQPLEETRLRDNVFLLAPGGHGGAALAGEATQVVGLPPAAFTRLVTVGAELAVFSGVTFTSEGTGARNNAATLLSVPAGGRVLLVGCTFIKEDGDIGDYVTIAAGGRVRFIGCLFLRGTSATNCIANAGVAADVQAVACARWTPAAHVAVTLVAGEVLP